MIRLNTAPRKPLCLLLAHRSPFLEVAPFALSQSPSGRTHLPYWCPLAHIRIYSLDTILESKSWPAKSASFSSSSSPPPSDSTTSLFPLWRSYSGSAFGLGPANTFSEGSESKLHFQYYLLHLSTSTKDLYSGSDELESTFDCMDVASLCFLSQRGDLWHIGPDDFLYYPEPSQRMNDLATTNGDGGSFNVVVVLEKEGNILRKKRGSHNFVLQR